MLLKLIPGSLFFASTLVSDTRYDTQNVLMLFGVANRNLAASLNHEDSISSAVFFVRESNGEWVLSEVYNGKEIPIVSTFNGGQVR